MTTVMSRCRACSHAEHAGIVCPACLVDAGVGVYAPCAVEPEDMDCGHENVERDDDGLGRRFWVCSDCDKEVYPTYGDGGWETVE